MVYESVVGKAPGGIDMVSFFSFLFPSFCFIETHDGYLPRRSASQKRAGLARRMVTWAVKPSSKYWT